MLYWLWQKMVTQSTSHGQQGPNFQWQTLGILLRGTSMSEKFLTLVLFCASRLTLLITLRVAATMLAYPYRLRGLLGSQSLK